MKNQIVLRTFCDSYVSLMKHWLPKPYILKWYEEPNEWLNEIALRHEKFSFIKHFIIQVDGEDISFSQYYPYEKGWETWHGSLPIEGTYSIDYLIGEESYLGKGYGKETIRTLCSKVFKETDAKRIIVQPHESNAASRNTLLSAGFTYNDKNQLFIIER